MRYDSIPLKHGLMATTAFSGAMLAWLAYTHEHDAIAFASAAILGGSLAALLANQPIAAPRRKVADDPLDLSHMTTEALHAHAMVFVTDNDGVIRCANDRFLAKTGYDRAALMGLPVARLRYRSQVVSAPSAQLPDPDGVTWTGEQRFVTKCGEVFWAQMTNLPWIDRKGQRQGTLSVLTDISQTKAAVAAQDAVTSLNLMSEPVFMARADTREIIFANQAAVKLFGLDGDNLAAVRISALKMICDRRAVREHLNAMDAGEIEAFSVTGTCDEVPYLADVQLIKAQGIMPRLYVVLRNQVAVQEVSRAKDELVATVSHELRTPLTSIKGALGLVRSGAAGDLTPKIRELLDIAYRNADRLVLIVNDILDLEKLAAGQMDYDMQCRDLIQTIREAIAANDSFAARFGVRVRLTADDAPAWALYDADRIHQVMSNLISNACKFSATGSTIDVTISASGQAIEVRVIDQGVGIPSGALENIFDRFTQVGKANRGRKGGTGLGLSIVKGIVESHGGTVDLSSVEGQGTTVTVTLRRAAAPVHHRAVSD